MTARGLAGGAVVIRWRTVEWWGAGVALFLQCGAVFPLMFGLDGLDDAARAKLRLLALPTYLITAVLLARCPGQLLIALRRTLPLTILLLLPFLSVTWSVSPTVSLRRAVGLLCSVALAYLLAIRFTPRQFLALTAAVLVPCMLVSLVLAAAVPRIGHMPMELGISGVRGVFIHKNVLGWYAAVSALVTGIMLMEGMPVPRRIGLLFLAASLACLVASASVTGMLSTIAALCLIPFYLALTRLRGASRTLLVLLFLQGAALLLIVLGEFLVPALTALGKDATLTGRVPLWKLVDAEIGRNLLRGFGYQAFWTEANLDAWRIWFEVGWMAPHAHNGYRDTLLNFGLIGFVIFLLTIVRAVRQGAVLHCRAPRDGWLWLNVLIGMFLVMNLTESLLLVQNEFLFTLFATAIVMFGLREPESLRDPARRVTASPAAGRLR